ncbi:MAG TPA: nucleotide exchange factor GrpE [Ignavibacteriaceae bacterium]
MMKEKKSADKNEKVNEEAENINENKIDAEAITESGTEKKISELELKATELQDLYLRKAAEFENYKRRVENDQFNLINYAAESFITKLLPVVDDFERSLKHISDTSDMDKITDGIKLMYDKFMKLLNDQGVKKMETVGKPFNVNYHDALLQKEDPSIPPHTVIEEIQPGYFYKDKVIRHAQVIVSSDSTSESSDIIPEDENNSEESN